MGHNTFTALSIIKLEETKTNVFRANAYDLWCPPKGRGVFGGQLLAQGMMAASGHLPDNFLLHSLHAYFLDPASPTKPIVYSVLHTRQGRRFWTRVIVAAQESGAVFLLQASFQLAESSSMDVQLGMPSVPPPEACPVSLWLERWFAPLISPLELRYVPSSTRHGKPTMIAVWVRFKDKLPEDNIAVHYSMLAYASDFIMHEVARMNVPDKKTVVMSASLDHAMWFYTPFLRVDEWLLFAVENPRSSSSRALTVAKVFRNDGVLVAYIAQEGLIRLRIEEEKEQIVTSLPTHSKL
jgi:acyl-CoA thioesterase-2